MEWAAAVAAGYQRGRVDAMLDDVWIPYFIPSGLSRSENLTGPSTEHHLQSTKLGHEVCPPHRFQLALVLGDIATQFKNDQKPARWRTRAASMMAFLRDTLSALWMDKLAVTRAILSS
jgi:hypothetical protein